jgi:hypothetical protein
VFWVKLLTPVATGYRTIFATARDLTGAYDGYAGIWTYDAGGGGQYRTYCNVFDGTTSITTANDITFTGDVWHPMAYVRNGSSHSFYYYSGLTLWQTLTLDLSGVTFTDVVLGGDLTGTGSGLEFANFREWTTNLSTTQIKNEINSATPLITANLATNTPLLTDYQDTSGNARHWTTPSNGAFVSRPTVVNTGDYAENYGVGGVALGYYGIPGPYTSLSFGSFDAVQPPEGQGEVPEAVEPATAVLESGRPLRLFAHFMIGNSSPYTSVAIAETTLRDPASYHGGEKRPWLISCSQVERQLTTGVRGVEVRLEIADVDRVFRTLATTETMSGSTVRLFLVDDETRLALGEPYPLFTGEIASHRALPGFRYEVVLRDVYSTHFFTQDDSPRIPGGRLSLTEFPGLNSRYEGRSVPLVIGKLNDEDEVGNFVVNPQGVVPMILVGSLNFQTAWGGIDRDVVAGIWSQCALADNGVWEGYYNTPDNPYTRVAIPASAWGTVVWTPGKPGWSDTGLTENFVDYPLPVSAVTRRYTPFFLDASLTYLDGNGQAQTYAQAIEDGRILVAGNMYGIAENADGTGRYLSDAPRIIQWIVTNFSPVSTPSEYRTGEYLNLPTFFGADYSVFNTQSIETATQKLWDFGGGDYPVGLVLGRDGQQETLHHVIQQICEGVAIEMGIDRYGRIMIDVEDPTDPAVVNLSDLLDIEDGSFEVWIDRDAYRNRVEYQYGYRYVPAVAPLPTPAAGDTLPAKPLNTAEDKWTSGLQILEHSAAITANRGLVRPMFIENYVVRSGAVADNVAQRLLDRAVGPSPSYDGPRMFRLTTSWQGLFYTRASPPIEIDLGTIISIDHLEGLGATGYEGKKGRILKMIVDPQRARVTLEGRILG